MVVVVVVMVVVFVVVVVLAVVAIGKYYLKLQGAFVNKFSSYTVLAKLIIPRKLH